MPASRLKSQCFHINGTHCTWTGVVGMVKRGEIDVGIADFTKTRNRIEIVDFGYPLIHARYV